MDARSLAAAMAAGSGFGGLGSAASAVAGTLGEDLGRAVAGGGVKREAAAFAWAADPLALAEITWEIVAQEESIEASEAQVDAVQADAGPGSGVSEKPGSLDSAAAVVEAAPAPDGAEGRRNAAQAAEVAEGVSSALAAQEGKERSLAAPAPAGSPWRIGSAAGANGRTGEPDKGA